MSNLINGFWSSIPRETEFWSAIVGAIVGGVIALFVQLIALRAAKKQRAEDKKETQRALGNSLLFKIIRIHSNFFEVHRHLIEAFAQAAKAGPEVELWQFVLPIANLPDLVHFSADEMGMLLAQKNDDVFNLVASMDVVHNSLIESVRILSVERRELTRFFRPVEVNGRIVSGAMPREEKLALQPRIIEVSGLIESVHEMAERGLKESQNALTQVNLLLRKNLGLTYRIESKAQQ